MQIEIIRPNGDLKREVWSFTAMFSYGGNYIYFDSYLFQTKETRRHKNWNRQTYWARLERRFNDIDKPPLPSDVEAEMREKFAQQVKELPIKM